MKQKILSVFTRIEAQKSGIISLYDSLSTDQLRFNPEPGQWNLLQVLSHLVTAEKQSILYIRRNLGRADKIPEAGPGSAIRFAILKLALWLPIKFKAPKVADVSEPYPDYEQLKEEWQSVRADTRDIIESADSSTLSKAIYKHPRAGLLNMKQALDFFGIHIRHHQKQISRIQSSPGFPQ